MLAVVRVGLLEMARVVVDRLVLLVLPSSPAVAEGLTPLTVDTLVSGGIDEGRGPGLTACASLP